MTNDELAELALYLRGLADQMDLESDAIPMNGQKIREAVQRLRDMPEGERIEGWVTDEGVHWALGQNPPIDRYLVLKMFKSQGVKECSATLTVHKRKEGD